MIGVSTRAIATIAAVALGVASGASLAQSATAPSDLAECGVGPSPGEASQTLFRLDGVAFQETDLPAALQQGFFDARHEHYMKERELIDAAVLELELERRAKASGRSKQEVAREMLAVTPPDDAEVDAFYQANKARIQYPLETVREQLRQMLTQRLVQTNQATVVEDLKRGRGFELVLAPPIAPYAEIATEGFPSKGEQDARVTIVEFADYQCPHCQRAADALKRIAERYPKDVRVVFMDFPVNRSGISRIVAEGAVCADEQGEFWPYHDLAFARQDTLSADSATRIAESLGLDVEAFRACLTSPLPRERVARAEGEARRLGLNATPTLFLNGRRLRLHDLERELSRAVAEALEAERS